MFGLCNNCEDFIYHYSDPRTKGWFLVDKLEYPLTIIALYLLFALKIGPWFMKNRKPFELKTPMQIFNLVQILINAYICYKVIYFMWQVKFDFRCQPFFKTTTPEVMEMVKIAWLYYMVKLSDIMDTVFFVLRKKEKQISFLHLYHHSAMIFFGHMGAMFLPDGGHALILGILNTLIHAIMYTYYFIAAMGPEYQKYIWWKKHLTSWQMIQFAILWVHNFQVLFRDCKFPRAINIMCLAEATIFLYLFGKFYIQSYTKNQQDSKVENGKTGGEKVKNSKQTANKKQN